MFVEKKTNKFIRIVGLNAYCSCLFINYNVDGSWQTPSMAAFGILVSREDSFMKCECIVEQRLFVLSACKCRDSSSFFFFSICLNVSFFPNLVIFRSLIITENHF